MTLQTWNEKKKKLLCPNLEVGLDQEPKSGNLIN